nr:hypothetical protein [Tanacetum cinerariifolium]
MGIYDFLCLPEWTGAAEVQEEPHHDISPTLERLPIYCTPPAVGVAIPEPTPKDLAAGTPSMAKAESSKKRKALLSGVAPSHVAKRTMSVMAQSSYLKTSLVRMTSLKEEARPAIGLLRPTTPEGVAASVITALPRESAKKTHAYSEMRMKKKSKNKVKEEVNTSDTRTFSSGRSRTPALVPISGNDSSNKLDRTLAILGVPAARDFFPFSAGPYYATYPEGGIAGNCELSREEWDAPHQPTLTILIKEVFKDPSVCKTIVDQFPTPGEMLRIKALTNDELTAKMSVLHCLMMSHGGELLARYRGLLKSHHDYVQSADSRLKSFEEGCAALQSLESQVSDFQKRVIDLNDKLFTSDAAFAKAKSKGEERNLNQLNAEVARLSAALNQATVLEAEEDEILRLKASPPEVQGELLSLAASAGFECGLSMHRTQEEFTAVLKKISHFVPGAQDRLVEASPLVAQTEYSFLNKISDHAADPLCVILQLEPEKLARPEGAPP